MRKTLLYITLWLGIAFAAHAQTDKEIDNAVHPDVLYEPDYSNRQDKEKKENDSDADSASPGNQNNTSPDTHDHISFDHGAHDNNSRR